MLRRNSLDERRMEDCQMVDENVDQIDREAY